MCSIISWAPNREGSVSVSGTQACMEIPWQHGHRPCGAAEEVFEEQFNFCQRLVCGTTRVFFFCLTFCLRAGTSVGCSCRCRLPLAPEESFIHIENQVVAQLGLIVQFTEAKVRNSPLSSGGSRKRPPAPALHQSPPDTLHGANRCDDLCLKMYNNCSRPLHCCSACQEK